jgi:hypothetical protein
MVRKDGEAIDPNSKTFELLDKPGEHEAYDRHIKDIFDGIKTFCAPRPGPCRVLFYFHGGLNSQKRALERASNLTCTIEKQNIYPIFVNWDSRLFSTWWAHVAHVHKGLWTKNRLVALAPYVVAVDEARSIVEAPTAWVAEWRHTFPKNQEAGEAALLAYKEMLEMQGAYGKMSVKQKKEAGGVVTVTDLSDPRNPPLLQDDQQRGETRAAKAKLLYSWWSKLLAPPLLIQAAGTGAWDVMQRRTAILFRTEAEFRGYSPRIVAKSRAQAASSLAAGTGQGQDSKQALTLARQYDTGAALAQFFTHFQEEFVGDFCDRTSPAAEGSPGSAKQIELDTPKGQEEGKAGCPERLEVSLVGHSMGTIIIDRLLRYAPNLQVKNIVFMGAATTVEDYRDTVDAYLDRHRSDKGGGPNMYHLVLHPLAEVSEQGFWDLSPRGSLLIWIDNYFTDPPTPLGRRAGRFLNIVPELLYTGKDTRSRVHLKIFRVGRGVRCWNPQKHGDFSAFPFWDKSFWDPKPSDEDAARIQRVDGLGCPKSEVALPKESFQGPREESPSALP